MYLKQKWLISRTMLARRLQNLLPDSRGMKNRWMGHFLFRSGIEKSERHLKDICAAGPL